MYLRIFFPTGKCYAAESHDPSLPEWPPHPSRLFSALVASAYSSRSGMTENKRKALEWLESLPAPSIKAPSAHIAESPTSYVPPGDTVGRKGTKGNEQYEHGIHRWRQPRCFPNSVIMDDPELHYCWQEDPEPEMLDVLDNISFGVTHVGTSHSMAVLKLYPGQISDNPSLLPHQNGNRFLRTPKTGRLKELDAVFQQSLGVRRPTPTCEYLAAYRSSQSPQTVQTKPAFLTLRISGTMHGADTAVYLGRAVRRAVMSVLGDNAPPAVHGHMGQNHMGWIPLPDVGHKHATGRIVGIGFIMPEKLGDQEKKEILTGISRVQDVRLPDGRISHLQSTEPGERLPIALRQSTWTRLSDTWATVTPVVLDRPPKKPRQDKIIKALFQSMAFAGYPEPADIQFSTFSAFKGAPPAFEVPADKPRYHAIVKFKEPVNGPVIAGRLRYFGIGLFRPISTTEELRTNDL